MDLDADVYRQAAIHFHGRAIHQTKCASEYELNNETIGDIAVALLDYFNAVESEQHRRLDSGKRGEKRLNQVKKVADALERALNDGFLWAKLPRQFSEALQSVSRNVFVFEFARGRGADISQHTSDISADVRNPKPGIGDLIVRLRAISLACENLRDSVAKPGPGAAPREAELKQLLVRLREILPFTDDVTNLELADCASELIRATKSDLVKAPSKKRIANLFSQI